MSQRWPTEKEAELIRLWPTNLSCLKIGERIGYSKGAVATKARSLELPSRRKHKRVNLTKTISKPRGPQNFKVKKCLMCREEFTPKHIHIFRCPNCLENARQVAPIAEGVSA